MLASTNFFRHLCSIRRTRPQLLLFLSIPLAAAAVRADGPVVYVSASATGANDGSSWADAFTDLQSGLDAAEASAGAITEIWVAQGTYVPSKRTFPDEPRSATFQLLDGVSLYGGFAGTETSIEQRDIYGRPTVLSGDLNGDDLPSFVNYDENSHHVVTGIELPTWTAFDGLTVTGGHSPQWSYGAGMYLQNARLQINNCTFAGNVARREQENVAWSGGGGAALFLRHWYTKPSSPALLHVSQSHFRDNSGAGDGGAVLIWSSFYDGSVDFSECTFERNVGDGALTVYYSACTLHSCLFSGNSSDGPGAAVFAQPYGGDVVIEASKFQRNTAGWGGAVAIDGGGSVNVIGSSFVENSSNTGYGGALNIYGVRDVEALDSEFHRNSGGVWRRRIR